ncbi:MAG: hypothetical protein ACU4EQ_09705 [Candidatus Nitrosoglobus sp.]|jgi:hypothetical protein
MYTLFLLVTIFLLGAYFLRDQIPIEFFRQNEKQVASVTAVVVFITGLLLTARVGGFSPKLGVFIATLGLLTLIAKQHPDTVLRTLEGFGGSWNPFTHRFFSPLLGWPLFLIGIVLIVPPGFWIDLITIAIIYGIAVAYAQNKAKVKVEP